MKKWWVKIEMNWEKRWTERIRDRINEQIKNEHTEGNQLALPAAGGKQARRTHKRNVGPSASRQCLAPPSKGSRQQQEEPLATNIKNTQKGIQ